MWKVIGDVPTPSLTKSLYEASTDISETFLFRSTYLDFRFQKSLRSQWLLTQRWTLFCRRGKLTEGETQDHRRWKTKDGISSTTVGRDGLPRRGPAGHVVTDGSRADASQWVVPLLSSTLGVERRPNLGLGKRQTRVHPRRPMSDPCLTQIRRWNPPRDTNLTVFTGLLLRRTSRRV